MADIVGFGDAGVQTALASRDGGFGSGKFFPDFGYDQAWRVDKHVRLLADINNDSMADIIGFGDAGVWTALSTGDGGFGSEQFALDGFGSHKYGEQDPRLVWHQQMNRGRHGVFHYVMGYETGGGSCEIGHIACGWNFNSANTPNLLLTPWGPLRHGALRRESTVNFGRYDEIVLVQSFVFLVCREIKSV